MASAEDSASLDANLGDIDFYSVGTARSSDVDSETIGREVKELSFDDETDESLPLNFGFETPTDGEALPCPLDNIIWEETQIDSNEQMTAEMRWRVTQLGMDIETPRGVASLIQEGEYVTPPETLEETMTQKGGNGSFYGDVGYSQRENELDLGEENVLSDERWGSSVESAAGGSPPSIPDLLIESDDEGGIPFSVCQKTTGKEKSLTPKGKNAKDSTREFEGTRGTSSTLGQVEKPVDTAQSAVEMATRGTQLNTDLEAALIDSTVTGKTVRAFLGALEALSGERALTSNQYQREVTSHFDDTPLSCTVMPNRGLPSINENVEAHEGTEYLSPTVEFSDRSPDVANPEATACGPGSDSGTGELTQFRKGSANLGRIWGSVDLGIDTGAREVTPLTLGIATAGGVMEVIIPRNTPIPTKKVTFFSTFVDYQTEVQIQIFEGERFRTMDNKLLATFELSGIPPTPRGVTQICVSIEIDAKGTLNVFVKDNSTGTLKQGTIMTDIGSHSKEMVEEMIRDGEKHKLEDEIHKRRVDAKRSLETYAYRLRDWISDEEVCRSLDPNDKEKMDDAVESVINWLLYKSWLFHCCNQLGEAAEFDERQAELKSICTPILEGIYQWATSPHSA